MILVTGAGGKTGRAVIRSLSTRGEKITALIHRAASFDAARTAGAQRIVVGDMRDEMLLRNAMSGAQKIYHVCPNVSPDEIAMGRAVIAAARSTGIEHFVYHSVLHPQAEKMPHHWNKMRVEEMLFESGLPFTIFQPTTYMQNILGSWAAIVENAVFALPYPVATRLSLVDLADVAQAAAIVLTEAGHDGATYELVGTRAMTQTQVAETLSDKLGRAVCAKEESVNVWEEKARMAGMSSFAIETLIRMFYYYACYGLSGNSNVLADLLLRAPTTLETFIERLVRDDPSNIHR